MERDRNPKEEISVTVVGIIILIILVLLAIYLFQRVRGGTARRY
jgi:flagellar biogenesis protein FliO